MQRNDVFNIHKLGYILLSLNFDNNLTSKHLFPTAYSDINSVPDVLKI